MKYSWDEILHHVAARIREEMDSAVEISEFVAPPKPEMGDVAFGCFRLAKVLQKSPNEVAQELAGKLQKEDDMVEHVSAAGPYVNFHFKANALIQRIVDDVETSGPKFGSNDVGLGKMLMLEYAQPNTHKEIHVGHLRNLVLGSSLAKMLHLAGWNVVTASYHGDVGAHVAKCLWHLIRRSAASGDVLRDFDAAAADQLLKAIPQDQRTGEYLGKLYTESSKILEEHQEWKDEVSFVQQQLEAHAPGWERIWQETRHWSLREMSEIFQYLGVGISRQYLESEVVDEGQKIVDQLLKQGIARESQGAMIVDLEDQKLGIFLIRKSDSTSLYATKDLALAQLKQREYPTLERSMMLVDNRQSLYFQQLFATLRLIGLKSQLEFVGYEFVTLKSGAMSSREGNIVTIEAFQREVLAYAVGETRMRHPDWSDDRVLKVAEALVMGGVKYGMLKQDSDKIFTFDLERALSFDGDTGPYLQYAVTRLRAIIKRASPVSGGDLRLLIDPREKALALQLALFPSTCQRAAEELRPALIAQWCLTLAHRVTEFYHEVNVLEAEPELRHARVRLLMAVVSVFTSALDLLGIAVPDEM